MPNPKIKKNNRIVIIGFIILAAVLIAWHLFFPLVVGGAIVITSAMMVFLVISIIFLIISIVFSFFWAGLKLLSLAVIACIWTLVGIILFPVFFPLLLPLLFIVIIVNLIRRKQKTNDV